MIESNALANLQMMMNTGDGRQAVLAELLDVSPASPAPIPGIIDEALKTLEPHDPLRSHSQNPVIREKSGADIRLLQRARDEDRKLSNCSESIIALLDKLPFEKKAPLTAFSEGLAYHYNNLLMAIMGYISIAMPHFKPGHPARKRLRDCEERIHNAAMLIRLLVDVFQRTDLKSKTLYPIDICNREIGKRIFSTAEVTPMVKPYKFLVLTPQIILLHIAGCMAKRLLLLFHTLENEVSLTLESKRSPRRTRTYSKRISNYIRRGINTAISLQEFSGQLKLNRSNFDLAELLNEAATIFQS